MEGGKLSVTFPNYHHTSEINGGKLIEVSATPWFLVTIKCNLTFSRYYYSPECYSSAEERYVSSRAYNSKEAMPLSPL